jgi:hypothetical protein
VRPALRRLAGAFAVVALAACSPPAEPARDPAAVISPSGAPLTFTYETLDGKQLTSDSLRGRITVIAFLTTYDFTSQAEARFLSSLTHRHVPRINAAALILEAPENLPLVQAFASTLALPYPVAMADSATIAGEGPFSGLHHVPSIVILDREGREVYRHVGLIEEAALDQAIRSVESPAR